MVVTAELDNDIDGLLSLIKTVALFQVSSLQTEGYLDSY